MMEANRASSSANEVSIRTWVWGRRARISRVASIPLPSASRTSMTTTSGRVRSASSIASLTEPASPATTMSSVAVRTAAMPPRTTSWSSTIRTRRGVPCEAIPSMVPRSRLRLNCPLRWQSAGPGRNGGDGLHGLTHGVDEVLHGGLRHAVQQGPVDGSPDHAQGGPVLRADRQLRPIRPEAGHLDVRLQRGEQRLGTGGAPPHGEHGLGREPDRLAQLDLDLLLDPPAGGAEPDLAEQDLGPVAGAPGESGHPFLRRPQDGGFHLLERQRKLEVIADEHAREYRAGTEACDGPNDPGSMGREARAPVRPPGRHSGCGGPERAGERRM